MNLSKLPIIIISIFATLVQHVAAKCIDLQTSCTTAYGGTPCRKIRQIPPLIPPTTKSCSIELVSVEAVWCNLSTETRNISKDSALILTGPAVQGYEKAIPTSSLAPGECDEAAWSFFVFNCSPYFNIEFDIKTDDKQCSAYSFERQMKTLCKADGRITCTLGGDSSSLPATKCESYEGPKFKIIKKEGCPDVKCIDQSPASCRQDVTYDFDLRNSNNQGVKFDLKHPNISNSKVAWKIVGNNKQNFADIGPEGTRTWSKKKTNVNICRVIPSASIAIIGNVVDPKTNKKAKYYQRCYEFDNQNVRKFDQEDGTKYPFCEDIGPIPNPSRSSPSIHSPPTCPGIVPTSTPSARVDESIE